MLAKEPSQGFQLRARLNDALGPLGDALNAGHIYVTLGRLEKAGFVVLDGADASAQRPDRKVYLTHGGRTGAALRVALGGQLAKAGPRRIPPEAHRGGRGRIGRPDQHRRRAAPGAVVAAARRATRRYGRTGSLERRPAARGHRAKAPSGLALAGGLRTELDRSKEHETVTDDPIARARSLRKEYGRGRRTRPRRRRHRSRYRPRRGARPCMGPSGCGKSTLLHLLGGLDRPIRPASCGSERPDASTGSPSVALAQLRRT